MGVELHGPPMMMSRAGKTCRPEFVPDLVIFDVNMPRLRIGQADNLAIENGFTVQFDMYGSGRVR